MVAEEILAQRGTPEGNATTESRLQALGRKDGGHLQNALVILPLLELGAGFLIDNERYVAMKLERGSSDRGCERSFNGFGDSGCLGGAICEKENPLCFENGADAHGDGALGNLFFGGEELAVVFDGFFAENFQTGSRTEAGGRFVESDVAVAADAENLQVDAARIANGLFVGRTILMVVSLDGAIGDVDVAGRHVHVSEKILMHEMVKTLRMVRREAQVFVEVECDDPREIQFLLVVQANELLVHSKHRASCG